MVVEALESDWQVEAVICEDSFDVSFLPKTDIPLYQASPSQFARLSSQQHPEGIIAIVEMKEAYVVPTDNLEEKSEGPAFLLWQIRDPGNLGTIMRTADWLGFSKVYVTPDSVDVFNPKTLRASMGSIFRCSVQVLSDPVDNILSSSRKVWIADMEGHSLHQVQFGPSDIILVGSESQGVDQVLKNSLHAQCISIPRLGGGESLNAAISASIIAWQLACQTQMPG